MNFKKNAALFLLLSLISKCFLLAQEKHYYQTDFSTLEFETRGSKYLKESETMPLP